jgi:plasmid stabilization system protein ParE
MPGLIWTRHALRDVQRLHAFLASKNPLAASRAVREIRQGVKLLGQHPKAGRPIEGLTIEFRQWPTDFGNSGYVAVYRYDSEEVVILSVRHAREFNP